VESISAVTRWSAAEDGSATMEHSPAGDTAKRYDAVVIIVPLE
jgi:hypothetical protein